jgi:hypothetical protein
MSVFLNFGSPPGAPIVNKAITLTYFKRRVWMLQVRMECEDLGGLLLGPRLVLLGRIPENFNTTLV